MGFIKHFSNSVSCAYRGIKDMFVQEPSFCVQIIIGVIVIALAFYLGITGFEWLLLLVVIGMVIAFEIFNTSIERILNYIHPDYDPKIKIIKDIAAASVLVTTLIAIVIGLIIFIPYFEKLFKN